MSETNPFDRVVEPWEAVMEDMEATAAEYREDGFSVIELHPGDVTITDEPGFDVLVPDDEYDELEAIATESTFDSYEVYRAEQSEIAFILLVLRDSEVGWAVCCPIYYDEREADGFQRRAREAGALSTHVRPLADDRGVTFTHENPTHFF